MLYDKAIPQHFKSKVCGTVVRPVATYGAEWWPVTKEIESCLGVMEMKMLWWTAVIWTALATTPYNRNSASLDSPQVVRSSPSTVQPRL